MWGSLHIVLEEGNTEPEGDGGARAVTSHAPHGARLAGAAIAFAQGPTS